ncbi:MAG: hypothetical protein J2P36_27910, partial [Ktedonobacteraceae bacterium]|nr:hypothetical protein [Ktedonobacteraceae bacterium]
MRDHHYTWRCWQIVFVVCVGCVLALLSSGGQALAASPSTSYALRLNVEVGYGSLAVYRAGHWVPIRVTIANAGSDFRGTLSINTYRTSTRVNNTGQSTWEFNQPVSVPQQQESHFTLYVPFTAGNTLPQGVIARLRDEQGRMITTETAHTGYEIRSGSLLVGVLADKSADLSALELLSLPTQSMLSSVRLDEDTLPTVSTILDSFDIIVLDDFSSARLSASQVLALQTWVNRGGILVEAGGPQWQRTLEPLPARLLPVNIRGSTTLPSGTHLVSSSDPLALTSDVGALTSPIPASI